LVNEKHFKLSRFVQFKLDEWIKFRKESREFMLKEVEQNEEKVKSG